MRTSLGQGSHAGLPSPVRWPPGSHSWSRQPRGSNTLCAVEGEHPQPGNQDAFLSWGCCDKMPQTRWLKTTEVYYLTILELRSSNSRCQQGHAPPKGSKEKSFLAFFLASDGCQQTLASSLACGRIPISASVSMGSSSSCVSPLF